MKGIVIVVLLVVAYGTYAHFRGQWPFRNRAIGDCAASGDMAYCLQYKYGWSPTDASVEALRLRVRRGL